MARTTSSRAAPLALALLLLGPGCRPRGSSAPAQVRDQGQAVRVPVPAVSLSARRQLRFLTATGTVRSYDAARRVLRVGPAGMEQSFVVAADARLWVGSRRAPIEQLATSLGEQATVAYAEQDGVRTTHTVRLRRRHGERGDAR